MKVATVTLSKFKRLQRRLKLPIWQAVGLLETLWWVTAQNAPQGDLGKLSNEDIAALLEWDGDHDELVAVLVGSRWLDECREHRLVVHDWQDHAPRWVLAKLRKLELDFVIAESVEASVVPTVEASVVPTVVETVEPSSSCKGGEGKGKEGNGKERKGKSARAPAPEIPPELDSPEFRSAFGDWEADRRERRLKAYTSRGLAGLYTELASWGEARAIAAIRLSIRSQWQGIHEGREGAGPPARASPAQSAIDRDKARTRERLEKYAAIDRDKAAAKVAKLAAKQETKP